MLLFPEGVEIGLCVGGDFLEILELGAGIVGTVGAGGDGSGQGAFSDFAELVAVVGLDARGVAAGAVDVFGFDGGVVQPRPFLGDFGAKGVVVVLRGDEGVALLAIQAAIGEHFFLLVTNVLLDRLRFPLLYQKGAGNKIVKIEDKKHKEKIKDGRGVS
jgi:hypothetical protein